MIHLFSSLLSFYLFLSFFYSLFSHSSLYFFINSLLYRAAVKAAKAAKKRSEYLLHVAARKWDALQEHRQYQKEISDLDAVFKDIKKFEDEIEKEETRQKDIPQDQQDILDDSLSQLELH